MVLSYFSIINLFSPGLKLIFTFTFEVGGNGNPVSSTNFFGKYRKYLPSFLLDMLPKLSLTNYGTPLDSADMMDFTYMYFEKSYSDNN